MIFTPENCKKVLSGQKTMTRRVVKDGERLLETARMRWVDIALNGRDMMKWVVGRTYAVQPGRGKKAVGRMKIAAIRRERLGDISEADCIAEGIDPTKPYNWGFTSRARFRELWISLYGDDPVKGWEANPDVWVISFELVGS